MDDQNLNNTPMPDLSSNIEPELKIPEEIPEETSEEIPQDIPPIAPRPSYQPINSPSVVQAENYVAPPPPPPPTSPEFYRPEPEKKGSSVVTMIVLIVSIIIILVLSGLLYYYATRPLPVENTTVSTATKTAQTTETTTPAVVATTPKTTVITFAVPSTLPTSQVAGSCLTDSISEPYRQDAFRCTVGATAYDPCFATKDSSVVFCQMNPISGTPFLIKSAKALPVIPAPTVVKDNWAWFVKLSDGTICAPVTGQKLTFNGKTETYGCRSLNKAEQVVLTGDLVKADQWTANLSVLEKTGTTWTEKSTSVVNVDTVWQ